MLPDLSNLSLGEPTEVRSEKELRAIRDAKLKVQKEENREKRAALYRAARAGPAPSERELRVARRAAARPPTVWRNEVPPDDWPPAPEPPGTPVPAPVVPAARVRDPAFSRLEIPIRYRYNDFYQYNFDWSLGCDFQLSAKLRWHDIEWADTLGLVLHIDLAAADPFSNWHLQIPLFLWQDVEVAYHEMRGQWYRGLRGEPTVADLLGTLPPDMIFYPDHYEWNQGQLCPGPRRVAARFIWASEYVMWDLLPGKRLTMVNEHAITNGFEYERFTLFVGRELDKSPRLHELLDVPALFTNAERVVEFRTEVNNAVTRGVTNYAQWNYWRASYYTDLGVDFFPAAGGQNEYHTKMEAFRTRLLAEPKILEWQENMSRKPDSVRNLILASRAIAGSPFRLKSIPLPYDVLFAQDVSHQDRESDWPRFAVDFQTVAVHVLQPGPHNITEPAVARNPNVTITGVTNPAVGTAIPRKNDVEGITRPADVGM